MLKILFLCTGNSCRSQMAEGWARRLKGDQIEAYSAGIEAHGLNPDAVRVMAEAGVDISGQRSKLLERVGGRRFRLRGDRLRPCPRVLSAVSRKGQGRPRRLRRSAATGGRRQDGGRATGPVPPRAGRNPRVCGDACRFPRPTHTTAIGASHEQNGRLHRQTFLPRSLSDRLDFPGDGGRRRAGAFRARHRVVHRPLPSGHDEHSHRHRPDPDDVSAAGQGEVRGTGRRVPRLEGAGAVAGAELGDRARR